MVRCANNTLYTGIALDVNKRFAEHVAAGPRSAKYLRGKGPLLLVYVELVGDKSAATRREIAVKKLPKLAKELLVMAWQKKAALLPLENENT